LTPDRHSNSQNESSPHLDLDCDSTLVSAFLSLFQQGVMLQVSIGSSIRNVLCRQYGIEDEYLDNRINTLFLDGKVVDNVDHAFLSDGSVLSLSASMPGFAGAALRKGGYYAGMRNAVTHSEEVAPHDHGTGFFVLKLFNMTIKEMGPGLLESGVWIEADRLDEFFNDKSDNFWAGCRSILIDDKEIPVTELRQRQFGKHSETVYLSVTGRI
jgi:hypothetical protein